jgi:hypothetical protein
MTASAFPSPNEIQRRVALAIGESTFTSLPTRLLPMLPNREAEKMVNFRFLRQVLRTTWLLWSGVGLLRDP